MLNSKLLIILLVIVLVLIILYIRGHKSVHHEIIIQASQEKVWSVLMNTDNYAQWNPVMLLLEGELKEGSKVKYRFTQDADNVIEIPSTVKQLIPQKVLNQGGGLPVYLTFDHKYLLEASGDGTKLTIHEDYAGIGVNFWDPAPVEAAYKRLNEAIKQQAEKD